jgi:hypothetical protein
MNIEEEIVGTSKQNENIQTRNKNVKDNEKKMPINL